jgi:GGDEF domain-containing protein
MSDLDEPVLNLISMSSALQEGTCLCEDVDRLFRHDRGLDHLVILRDRRPVGLITRQSFYLRTGGPVGYHLFSKKPAETAGKFFPLVVDEEIQVTAVAKLAMERSGEDLYDPVIVAGRSGEYLGTLTIRQLIARATELELESAQCANPLTGLPGNRSIGKWIREALELQDFFVVYADLDRFKEYNDRYGFLRGDEMIRLAGRVLVSAEEEIPGVRVGHLGGDDFVLVAPVRLDEGFLERICRAFDEGKASLFAPEDLENRTYRAQDRQGNSVEVPLATLSLAVVDGEHLVSEYRHPAYLSQSAASLKKVAKRLSAERRCSSYAVERRFRVAG